MKLIIFLLAIAGICGMTLGGMALVYIDKQHPPVEYDYLLELRNDTIFVTSEYGVTNAVYADQLEEYLIWDNL